MRAAPFICLALLLTSGPADAWSRPGHMVTAAIAYADLAEAPAVKAAILDLLEAHPDRGTFEVAIDRTVGEDRARRIFYECARWPDDARGTAYDHPTWHYAARPVVAAGISVRPADRIEGDAIEAFALHLRVLSDRKASKGERAVALCSVMHLVGDIHQPLHTAQLFSPTFPDGDELGSKQFVRLGAGDAPVTLHWAWDDSVQQSGAPASVEARASELVAQLPFLEERATGADFATWAHSESYLAATAVAYGHPLSSTSNPVDAPVLASGYVIAMRRVANRSVTIAGHRIASLLLEALGTP